MGPASDTHLPPQTLLWGIFGVSGLYQLLPGVAVELGANHGAVGSWQCRPGGCSHRGLWLWHRGAHPRLYQTLTQGIGWHWHRAGPSSGGFGPSGLFLGCASSSWCSWWGIAPAHRDSGDRGADTLQFGTDPQILRGVTTTGQATPRVGHILHRGVQSCCPWPFPVVPALCSSCLWGPGARFGSIGVKCRCRRQLLALTGIILAFAWLAAVSPRLTMSPLLAVSPFCRHGTAGALAWSIPSAGGSLGTILTLPCSAGSRGFGVQLFTGVSLYRGRHRLILSCLTRHRICLLRQLRCRRCSWSCRWCCASACLSPLLKQHSPGAAPS